MDPNLMWKCSITASLVESWTGRSTPTSTKWQLAYDFGGIGLVWARKLHIFQIGTSKFGLIPLFPKFPTEKSMWFFHVLPPFWSILGTAWTSCLRPGPVPRRCPITSISPPMPPGRAEVNWPMGQAVSVVLFFRCKQFNWWEALPWGRRLFLPSKTCCQCTWRKKVTAGVPSGTSQFDVVDDTTVMLSGGQATHFVVYQVKFFGQLFASKISSDSHTDIWTHPNHPSCSTRMTQKTIMKQQN